MNDPLRGMLWMGAAALCFSAMFGFIRHLSDTFSTFEIVFLRQVMGLCVMGPIMLRAGLSNVKTEIFHYHLIRAIASYLALLSGYYALTLIVLSDAVALQFTLPIFTALMAIVLLKERVGIYRWGAIGAGFVGVLIIVRPGFEAINLGILLALAAAACHGVGDSMAKLISRTDPTSRIVFWGFAIQLPISAIPMPWVWVTPGVSDIAPLLGFGAVAIAAQWCLTKSFSLADASLVSPVLFLRLPFVAAIGFFFFDQSTDIWTWAGAGVIFISTWILAKREAAAAKQAAS